MTQWVKTARAVLLATVSMAAATTAQAQTAASTPAPGQQAAQAPLSEPAEQAPAAQNSPDDVVVVGSQIQGAKRTGALPVTVIGEDRIAATGAVSGDDLFRSIPQAGDVQFQEARTTGNLNDARGDNASINLRNVGTGNTLVLLNGRRMVPTPGTQTENFVPVQTVNTNSIPVGATRRLEILRDGAGAIYGSDAVAGVVNIVLDDRFKGFRADARYGFADGTKEATINLKAGARLGERTEVMAFGSYTHRTPLFASERPFSASEDHRAYLVGTPFEGDTGFDNRSTSSPWGSFTVVPSSTAVRQGTTALTTSGVFHVEPTSNTAAPCSSTVYGGNLCLRAGGITGAADRPLRYDENPDRTIRGGLDRFNAFATLQHDFGATEFYSEAGYYHASLDGQREQSAPISSSVITVPATNYWNPFGATTINGVANPNRLPNLVNVPAAGLALTITNYRPVDTGPRTFTVTDDSVRLLGGFRGRFGDAWRWDSAITYSWARTDDNTHNAISNTAFQAALAKATPDAYNPFNGGTQPAYSLGDATPSDAATIRSFLVEVHRISKTSLLTGDFKVSNPRLFALPGGDVGVASGVEFRRESYSDDRDPRLDGTIKYTDLVSNVTYLTDVMGASPAPDVSANRTVLSAFVELAVPLVNEDMNIPLVRTLDLQLAARDERYSDFGNVLKPKVAGSWGLFDGWKFRASWSQSFRAPNLPQFYSAGTQVSNTRTDYLARVTNLTAAGTSAGTLEVRSGNRGLKPDESTNFSAGVVLQPPAIPGLVLTVDYWSIRQRDVIGIQGAQNQILYDLLLRRQNPATFNPNVVRLPSGQISFVQDNYTNLNPRTLKGWDIELEYAIRNTGVGSFNLQAGAAYLAKYQQQPSELQDQLIAANSRGELGPGISITGANSLISQNGNPRWRASGSIDWKLGQVSANVLVNYVGPVFDTGSIIVDNHFWQLPGWTTVNAYIQYRVKGGLLDDTRFRLGARNLFDRDPPIASNNFGFLGSLHSALGRFVYAEVSKSFR